MYFAFSDVHGHSELMKNRIEQILPYLKEGDNKLIMLGDFIDRGKESFSCLKMAYDEKKKRYYEFTENGEFKEIKR